MLKALANPPKIFNVPYTLALLNFVFWFVSFIVVMVILLLIMKTIPMWISLFFLGGLFLSHMILGFFSKKDPQIAQIIFATLRIFKNKIPRKLVI